MQKLDVRPIAATLPVVVSGIPSDVIQHLYTYHALLIGDALAHQMTQPDGDSQTAGALFALAENLRAVMVAHGCEDHAQAMREVAALATLASAKKGTIQ